MEDVEAEERIWEIRGSVDCGFADVGFVDWGSVVDIVRGRLW
jgi:hypothetical protein